jgi:hypothetical protein
MRSKPRLNQFLRRSRSSGFSHRAHCVGFSVAALIALMSAVAAITSANWRYICPLMPGMNAAGRNTDMSTSVMPMIGPMSSRIASMEAVFAGAPCSRR